MKPSKKKTRNPLRDRALSRGLRQPSQIQQQQRYWNEYDDDSEGSDNGSYAIYVNPDAAYTLPGSAAVKSVMSSLGSKCKIPSASLKSWLKPRETSGNREQAPLINGGPSPNTDDSDISDDDIDSKHALFGSKRHYSTFPTITRTPAVRARERLLFRSCLASFAASLILLLVAAILETTGRRKAVARVDAGVVIGVAAGLVFAIIAVGCMLGRKDQLGWAHRGIVSLMFVLLVIASVGILAALR